MWEIYGRNGDEKLRRFFGPEFSQSEGTHRTSRLARLARVILLRGVAPRL